MAYGNDKGFYIAKQIVLSKMKGQNLLLSKHGFNLHDPKIADSVERVRPNSLIKARGKLVSIEGKYTQQYFRQILQLFPEKLRPESRKKFKAYDGINNNFNLAYEVLSWEVHRALIKAKLEPYLGFLHSVQFGKPSLVCDFQELYRYLIDNFVIQYCQKLRRKDFIVKAESVSRKRKGKREYLNDLQTRDFMKQLYRYLARASRRLRFRGLESVRGRLLKL